MTSESSSSSSLCSLFTLIVRGTALAGTVELLPDSLQIEALTLSMGNFHN